MRQPIAIVNARPTPNISKQVTYYSIEKTGVTKELPYKLTLYNASNYGIYCGLFASKETAEAYAQDRIDMTTPLY